MLGQFASMNMQMVTGSLLLYRLTGSAALLGTLSLSHAIPMIFLSMFGGAIADRLQKKRILCLGLLCSAAVSLGIALPLTTGFLSRENPGSWWILMLSSFFQGIIMGLMLPARQAIIPEMVSKEQAMNAIALNTLGMNVLRFLAPGVAGFLIDAFDFKAVYYAMTGMNLYAAAFMFFVPHTSRTSISRGNLISDIRDALDYIMHQRIILIILVFTLGVVILSMPYQQLLPIFVDDILKVGATGMGVLMSVSGIGAMVGSLILASLPNKKRGVILLSSGLISGVFLINFAFSTSWVLSIAFIVFIGLGQTIRATSSNALLQSYVEPRYMGRVLSVYMMEWGLLSVCTFIAGLISEVVPVQWVIGGFAMALTVLCILALVFIPSIRKLD
jgi:MFS transporter, DHA1 family, staphyloferrin A biosynthesis exporter